ncbi:hypothetical protein EG494_23535 [Salmonella enterica]|nr:hypothetical protein [Salmonella enterica]
MDYLCFAGTGSDFGLLLTIRHQENLCQNGVIRTQSPQQLDDLKSQYKNHVPIVQVQPVTIY